MAEESRAGRQRFSARGIRCAPVRDSACPVSGQPEQCMPRQTAKQDVGPHAPTHPHPSCSAHNCRPTCQKTSRHCGIRSGYQPLAAGCRRCRWARPAGHRRRRQAATPVLALLLAAAPVVARHCTAHQAAACYAAVAVAELPSSLLLHRCRHELRSRAAAAARAAVVALSPSLARPPQPSGLSAPAAALQAAWCSMNVRWKEPERPLSPHSKSQVSQLECSGASASGVAALNC